MNTETLDQKLSLFLIASLSLTIHELVKQLGITPLEAAQLGEKQADAITLKELSEISISVCQAHLDTFNPDTTVFTKSKGFAPRMNRKQRRKK